MKSSVNESKWQPSGVYILGFVALWDRFSFYGSSALLVIYLSKYFSFLASRAYGMLAFYMLLSFILPVFGGILADRLLNFERAVVLGMGGVIIGNVFLTIAYSWAFYVGLVFLLLGTGLIRGNIAGMIGDLYSRQDARRSTGFTIFYMFTNLGTLLGPLAYMLASVGLSYHFGFIISALGMILALILYLLYISKGFFVVSTPKVLQKSLWRSFTVWQFFWFGVVAFLILFSFLFAYGSYMRALLSLTVVVFIILLFSGSFKGAKLERNRVIGVLTLGFLGAFSFACSFQMGRALTLFFDQHARAFFGFQIPAVLCNAIQPFSIVILVPVMILVWNFFSRREIFPSVVTKLLCGIFCACVSYVVFFFHRHFYGGDQLAFIAGGNLLLGVAELLIAPSMMAIISKIAPQKFTGTLMGVWFMLIAFAVYVSAFLVGPTMNNAFTNTGIIVFMSFIVTLLLMPWLKGMLRENEVVVADIRPLEDDVSYMNSFYGYRGIQEEDAVGYDYSNDENDY